MSAWLTTQTAIPGSRIQPRERTGELRLITREHRLVALPRRVEVALIGPCPGLIHRAGCHRGRLQHAAPRRPGSRCECTTWSHHLVERVEDRPAVDQRLAAIEDKRRDAYQGIDPRHLVGIGENG